MKLTIFQARPYDFTSDQGERITGTMYGAFDEKNYAFEFSSKSDYRVHDECTAYDPSKAEEVDIKVSIFNGKVKRAERVSY